MDDSFNFSKLTLARSLKSAFYLLDIFLIIFLPMSLYLFTKTATLNFETVIVWFGALSFSLFLLVVHSKLATDLSRLSYSFINDRMIISSASEISNIPYDSIGFIYSSERLLNIVLDSSYKNKTYSVYIENEEVKDQLLILLKEKTQNCLFEKPSNRHIYNDSKAYRFFKKTFLYNTLITCLCLIVFALQYFRLFYSLNMLSWNLILIYISTFSVSFSLFMMTILRRKYQNLHPVKQPS